MALEETFKAGYFYRLIRKDYNPFTPDVITVDDQVIGHRRRNWYLLSTNYQKYHFENVIGLDVHQQLFGADIVIETTGSGTIRVKGFSKSSARQISDLCRQYIIRNTPRNVIDVLTNNLNELVKERTTLAPAPASATDELIKLKGLLDSGAITSEEYTQLKKKILDQNS